MNRYIRVITLLVLAGMLGCGAYFNTYYNAKKAYESGIQKVEKSGNEKSGNGDFNNCLQISSKLLQFYPESRWIDDTILLIGQSYVNLGQYHRALRKFDELAERFPQSSLLITARIWRAKALRGLFRYDQCRTILSGINADNLDRELGQEYFSVWAELYKNEDNLDKLVETLRRQLDIAKGKINKGNINYEIGLVLVKLGQYEEAVKHFRAVRKFRPGRDIEFEALLAVVDNLTRSGKHNRAASRLKSLKKDERFFDNLDRVEYRFGVLSQVRGETIEAMELFHAVLDEYPKTIGSAAASFQIGNIYINQLDEADSAEVYFKRTKSEKSSCVWADSSKAAMATLSDLQATLENLNNLWFQIEDKRVQLIPDSAFTRQVWADLPNIRAALKADSLRQDSLALADSVIAIPDSLTALAAVTDSLAIMENAAGIDSVSTVIQSAAQRSEVKAPLVDIDEQDLPENMSEQLQEPPSSTKLNPKSKQAKNRGRNKGKFRLFDRNKKIREAALKDSLRQVAIDDSLLQIQQVAEKHMLDSLLVSSVLDTALVDIEIDSLLIENILDSLLYLHFESRFVLAEIYYRKLEKKALADSLLSVLYADTLIQSEQASQIMLAHGMLRYGQFADSSGGEVILEDLINRYPLEMAANPARKILGLELESTIEDSAAVLLLDAERYWLEEFDPMLALESYDLCVKRYGKTESAYTALLASGTIALDLLEDPELAYGYFRTALNQFPERSENAVLRKILGEQADIDVSENTESVTQDFASSEAVTDDSGNFIDTLVGHSLEERIQTLRDRFAEIGRLKVDRIIK
jgi:TolA-binding protein